MQAVISEDKKLKPGITKLLSLAHPGAFWGRYSPDHPLKLMELTPHIGGATFDTERNHSKMIANDIVRLLNNERPLYIANPEVLSPTI